MLEMVWAFIKGDRHIFIPIGTGVLGLLIGYLLFGVVFAPNPSPETLPEQTFKQIFLRSVATSYASDANFEGFAGTAINEGFDNPAQTVCNAIQEAQTGPYPDPIAAQNLARLLPLASNAPVDGNCATVAPIDEGSSFLATCGLGLLLLLLVGGFGFVLRQRRADDGMADYDIETMTSRKPTEVPTDMPTLSGDGDSESDSSEGSNITAIASYRTTFVRGYDAYDDSFSIENVNGDFLGECGVGISESIGTDSPKSVTALEVWLFDKNDIRTITKVAMSDHAFFDEAIKAKLAPKGEPVLAREDEVVVLETASLIINAKITELVYGDNPELPEKSYFEKFGIEISAWSQGDASTSGGGGGSDDIGFDF